jgi:hypothetical protein
LPADLKAALTRLARQRGVSEAEVIRASLRDAVSRQRPRPRAGLYSSGDPIAHRVDELLVGFGDK